MTGGKKVENICILNFRSEAIKYLPNYELLLAKCLEKEYNIKTDIITILNYENIQKYIDKIQNKYDLILLYEFYSTKAPTYVNCYFKIAKMFKKQSKTPLLFGGYWASHLGRFFKEFDVFDALLEGYSIKATAKVISQFAEKKKKRFINVSGNVNFGEYELDLKYLKTPWKYMNNNGNLWGYMTAFGCPNNCLFCFVNAARKFGACLSARSEQQVFQDLIVLNKFYNFKTITIKDSNFFYDKERAFKILKWLKDNNKEIRIQLDITLKDINEEILIRFNKSGIGDHLFFGLESMFEKRRKQLGKPFSDAELHKAYQLGDEYNFRLSGTVILGFPWQKKEEIKAEIKKAMYFVHKYKSAFINFNAIIPEYGTDIQMKYFPNLHKFFTFGEILNLFKPKKHVKYQSKIYGQEFQDISFQQIWLCSRYINLFKKGRDNPFKFLSCLSYLLQKKYEKDLFKLLKTKKLFRLTYSEKSFLIIKNILAPILELKKEQITLKGLLVYFKKILSLRKIKSMQ